VTVKISECVRCGRAVGIAGREHCARCRYALAHRPARNQCPGCGQPRKLDEATGKCVLCSRACVRCGGKIGRVGRDICSLCLVKDRRAAAQQRCPRCGKPGRIRDATGWCGHCSHPGRPPDPDHACLACGLVTHLAGDGLCLRCYTKSPHRITVRAENLAARLSDPPSRRRSGRWRSARRWPRVVGRLKPSRRVSRSVLKRCSWYIILVPSAGGDRRAHCLLMLATQGSLA
jgi:hypothetical protein